MLDQIKSTRNVESPTHCDRRLSGTEGMVFGVEEKLVPTCRYSCPLPAGPLYVYAGEYLTADHAVACGW